MIGAAEVDCFLLAIEQLVELGCPFCLAGAATEFAEDVAHAAELGDSTDAGGFVVR